MSFKTTDDLKQFLAPTIYECGECNFTTQAKSEMETHTVNHKEQKAEEERLKRMEAAAARPIPELRGLLDDI